MPKINPNDPAFPIAQGSAELVDQGLTKLEYFAGQFMAANLTGPSARQAALECAGRSGTGATDFLAKCSVQQAQALIQALQEVT